MVVSYLLFANPKCLFDLPFPVRISLYAYSTVDRNRNSGGDGAAGDEIITEYATTRRLDISMAGPHLIPL